jgi:hypothetical protein
VVFDLRTRLFAPANTEMGYINRIQEFLVPYRQIYLLANFLPLKLLVNNGSDTYIRFVVFTAVTMKNAVFWDIKTQFILHRRQLPLRYRVRPINAM